MHKNQVMQWICGTKVILNTRLLIKIPMAERFSNSSGIPKKMHHIEIPTSLPSMNESENYQDKAQRKANLDFSFCVLSHYTGYYRRASENP